jgi:hypothetical protein
MTIKFKKGDTVDAAYNYRGIVTGSKLCLVDQRQVRLYSVKFAGSRPPKSTSFNEEGGAGTFSGYRDWQIEHVVEPTWKTTRAGLLDLATPAITILKQLKFKPTLVDFDDFEYYLVFKQAMSQPDLRKIRNALKSLVSPHKVGRFQHNHRDFDPLLAKLKRAGEHLYTISVYGTPRQSGFEIHGKSYVPRATETRRRKTQGFTHRVQAWMRPAHGGDYEVVSFFRGKPTKAAIDKMLVRSENINPRWEGPFKKHFIASALYRSARTQSGRLRWRERSLPVDVAPDDLGTVEALADRLKVVRAEFEATVKRMSTIASKIARRYG